jgi:hypothetical protein
MAITVRATGKFEWSKRYEGMRIGVDDASSGRSSAVTCVEVTEQIDQRIRDN